MGAGAWCLFCRALTSGCGWWSLDLQVCTGWRRVCSELMPLVELDFGRASRGPDLKKTNPLTDLGLGAVLGGFRAVRSLNLCTPAPIPTTTTSSTVSRLSPSLYSHA